MEIGQINAKAAGDFIQMYGASADLEVITLSGTVDDWSDTPQEFATSAIMCVFQNANRNDLWSKQGLLEQGDMIAFVKSSVTVKIRDRILKSSVEYDVVAIETIEFQGSTTVYKLALKRNAA